MAALTIEQMRQHAQANFDDANDRLKQLRAEKQRIADAIKATVAERDEAARIVKKLAPPKPRASKVIPADDPILDEAPE